MVFPNTDLDVIIEAFLGADPNDDPETWPAATDLSSRLIRKPINIRRGRGTNQKTAQAGACTLWLDNTDGALTPLLPTSTYYPFWDLGVPLRVSVDNVGDFPPYVRHAGFVVDVSAVMVPGVGGLNISAVQVTSAGVLRRLGQGAAVKSALRRTIGILDPVAYWPLEDGENSTVAASGIAGGAPMTQVLTGVEFGSGTTPDGSAAAVFVPSFGGTVDFLDPAVLAGPVSGAADNWCVEFMAYTPYTADDGFTYVRIPAANWIGLWGGVHVGIPSLSVPRFRAFIVTASGTTFLAQTADYTDLRFWDTSHHYAAAVSQSGGNIFCELFVDGVSVASGTNAGTVAAATGAELTARGSGDGISISHLAIFNASTPSIDPAALDAYAGEEAHERIDRNLFEEGINYSGGAVESNECGPQPVADLLAVLQDAETVDHGMLIEDFAWGLNYLASTQRVNVDASLTINLATYRTTAGTQADVLTPVRNDARISNEWTIDRPAGSSETVADEAHIAKRGRYAKSATVNVDGDGRLRDEAQWRVHEGTFEGLRYDTVPLDIAANL